MTEAEVNALADELLGQSMVLTGCERGGRRYCCSYHEGFTDGLDAMIEALELGEG